MTMANVTPATTVSAIKQEPSSGATQTPESNPSTQAPPVKTFTESEWQKREAEWNKKYGGLDSKLTKVSQSFAKLQEDHAKTLEAQRTFEEQAEIKAAEAEGADPNLVKGRFAKLRAAEQQLADLTRREEIIKAQETFYADIARKEKANSLVTELQLGSENYEKLLESPDLVTMENAAFKLAWQRKAQAEIPAQTVDSGGKLPGEKT